MKTSLTGPTDKMKKISVSQDQAMNDKLDQIIAGEYKTYEDRMASVAQACQGLDDLSKIRMSSQLARRLSSIYDYGRANGGSNEVISPEKQWQSLKAGVASGVCRDASITVSQFLLACGFKKEQLAIKSYRTTGGGHQVTSIRTPDGEFTVNWGELYNNENTTGFTSPNPNLANTGLTYTLYDPESGKILEQRRTELGDALKLLAGGTVKDPTYTPSQIVAEAAFGGFAAKVFEVQTNDGDKAKGAALSYTSTQQTDRSYMDLAVGAAYVKNEKPILNNDVPNSLKQDIIYFSMEGKGGVTVPVFENKAGKLTVTPTLAGTMDFTMTQNQYNDNKAKKNMDMYTSLTPGVTATFETGKVEVYASGAVEGALKNGCYNSERQSGNVCVYSNRYTLTGGMQYNGKLTVGAEASTIKSRTDKLDQYAIKVANSNISCRGTYNVYTPSFGKTEKYTYDSCSTKFSIGKAEASVGGTYRKPLSENTTRGEAVLVDFGLKF